MGQLFNRFGMAIAGHKKGPAKVAVISSGFMGSINGSVIERSVRCLFTIPFEKVGYRKTLPVLLR
jgi:TRAP-type uncharacterized transport system fused permease subunit